MAEPRKTGRRTSARAKVNVPEEDAYGHVQPQALEFEEAVLGALMIEQDAYSQVSEILRPESFYDHRHQLIYEAIRTLNLQQKPVDILTVTEHLNTMGKLEEVGGPFYITQLSGKVASSAHIEYHARIIAQKFLARELITFTSLVQTKAFDTTVDVDDLMQEAEGKLFEISQQNMKKDYTQINPVIREAYDMLQKAAARSDGQSAPNASATSAERFVRITSSQITRALAYFSSVTFRIGINVRSISSETTCLARSARGLVSAPNPGPISRTQSSAVTKESSANCESRASSSIKF